jgi:small subunit ribosomal protein S3
VGQKTHPTGFRLGVIKTWSSRWYADRDFSRYLHEDLRIRKYIKEKLYHAGIARIDIERAANKSRINIFTARPGIIIGKKGSEIEKLKGELQRMTDKEVYINISEVQRPETDSQLIAENVCLQLERRVAFRRAMKKAVTSTLKCGAQGIKITCAGRLGGAEMARTEWYREGRVPLHTLRADIDYGFAEAKTTYGIIGVKVWVFHGETLTRGKAAHVSA